MIMTLLLDSPDAPLETGLFTYKLVAYAGEGWESQTPTNMRIYPIAMTFKFQQRLGILAPKSKSQHLGATLQREPP